MKSIIKEFLSVFIPTAIILILAFTATFIVYLYAFPMKSKTDQNVFQLNPTIHSTITMYRNGQKIFEEYHAGTLTKLGKNYTLCKLTGSTWYNTSAWLLNTTYISIGNQGTLNTDSTVLPSEWNRTLAVCEDQDYNSFNLTCTFKPDTGPYTADCLGVNYEDGIGNNALWGYDAFTEVSGIDSTFTINIEVKVAFP